MVRHRRPDARRVLERTRQETHGQATGGQPQSHGGGSGGEFGPSKTQLIRRSRSATINSPAIAYVLSSSSVLPMHGVPANLDLSIFRRAVLTQVGIGEFQIQFHLHPAGLISVEGNWELLDSAGTIIDRAKPNEGRDVFRLHVPLGKTVERSSVDAPRSFSLGFESGYMLTVFDDSREYESFSIQPGDIFV